MDRSKQLLIKEALEWIVGVLKKHDVPFQITGGLAAHAYGATRPIDDIDIDIPEDRFRDVLEDVRPFLVEGPDHVLNDAWDIYAMTLMYKGQEIDIGSAVFTIKDRKTGLSQPCIANFDTAVMKNIFGINVPVVDISDLIEYKSFLSVPGDHQEQDVRDIQGFGL